MGYKTLQDPQLPTPAYVIDEERLRKNGEVLAALAERTGCRVLLAQKAFSNYDFYPLLSRYLAGTEASGLYEARLGKEEMPQGEVHVFCGAYREDEFQELLQYADHIVFNSIHQLKAFGPRGKQAGKSLGLRVNPECSTQEGHAIYDPCAPGSRMGVTRNVWDQEMDEATLSLLDGIHFHTLCEQNSDDLKTTLAAVEEKFGDILPEMKWINMGGGMGSSRSDTDIMTRIFGQPGAGRGGKRRCQDRHLGRQRRLPHARRAGNALPAPHPGGQYRARGGPYVPPGRPHLSGRGRDRGLRL